MHIDPTLKIFKESTILLGQKMRDFVVKTCPAFDTRELKRETNARNRRRLKNPTRPDASASISTTRQRKTFNIQTYKFHSLGDYPDTIEKYGTCDSYTTELVSDHLLSTPPQD
jgi:hypothetical protein